MHPLKNSPVKRNINLGSFIIFNIFLKMKINALKRYQKTKSLEHKKYFCELKKYGESAIKTEESAYGKTVLRKCEKNPKKCERSLII